MKRTKKTNQEVTASEVHKVKQNLKTTVYYKVLNLFYRIHDLQDNSYIFKFYVYVHERNQCVMLQQQRMRTI